MNIENVDLVRVLDSMEAVDGWFYRSEGELLCKSLMRSMVKLQGNAIVEIGSYLGRSTIALGLTIKMAESDLKVYAIDPHEGVVTYPGGPEQLSPTFEGFRKNIEAAGISDIVVPIIKKAHEVVWDRPISFMFIDGLHDYKSVSGDFRNFEKWVVPDGWVAFHDYAENWPGIKRCVDEILSGGKYSKESMVGSLVILRKLP
jgi:predicted O-methyltransferase YrrM